MTRYGNVAGSTKNYESFNEMCSKVLNAVSVHVMKYKTLHSIFEDLVYHLL